MDFHRVELSDRPWIVRLLREDPQRISDASFSYQFAHADAMNTLSRVAEVAGRSNATTCGYNWAEFFLERIMLDEEADYGCRADAVDGGGA